MRKRFDPMWRIAVALMLVISLAPLAVLAGVTQADTPVRPETYMDPIPPYINNVVAGSATPYISGTSLDSLGSSPVVDVQVQIERMSDHYRWSDAGGGAWVDNPDRWNSVTPAALVQEIWTTDQWAWTYGDGGATEGPAPADLDSAGSYRVYARAVDGLGFQDLSPAYRDFIYDDAAPDVSFTTTFGDPLYALNSITGTASDDDGVVNQVRLKIQNTDDTVYWNGQYWQVAPVWIKAEGTTSWKIDKNTNPPLPLWQHEVSYSIELDTADKAGNRDAAPPAAKNFTFRVKRTTDGVTINSFPKYVNDNYFVVDGGLTWIAGTARPNLGKAVFEVRVKIKDSTANKFYDGRDWDADNELWETTLDWVNAPLAVLGAAWDGHENWEIKNDDITDATVPATIHGYPVWQDGHSYQIQVRMQETDAAGKTYLSNTVTFVYDITHPDTNIDAFDDIVYNSLTSITGVSGQDPGLTGFNAGEIGGVVMRIQRNWPGPLDWWDGAGWGRDEWGDPANDWWYWLFATAQDGNYNQEDEKWKVTSTTNPPLPQWVNNVQYTIDVRAFDKAGNLEATDTKVFTFRVDLEGGYTPPAPPVTPGPTPEPTYSPGPEPTYSPGPAPTQSPGPQPTQSPGPQPTQSPGPQPSPGEPTPTPTPETSVTKTIGAGGGEICLEDNRVCVDFPAGAFGSSTEVTITLETVGGTICLNAPEGYSPGNTCFTISPSSELAAAADVCVEYTNYEYYNAADGDAGRLKLAYQAGGEWTVLKTTVDISAGTACAQTKHLSSWVTAIEDEKEGMEWLWWYWVIIGVVALIVIVVIILLFVRPRRGGEEEDEGDYEEEL